MAFRRGVTPPSPPVPTYGWLVQLSDTNKSDRMSLPGGFGFSLIFIVFSAFFRLRFISLPLSSLLPLSSAERNFKKQTPSCSYFVFFSFSLSSASFCCSGGFFFSFHLPSSAFSSGNKVHVVFIFPLFPLDPQVAATDKVYNSSR